MHIGRSKLVAKLEQRDGLGSYRRLPRGGIEEVQMMEMHSFFFGTAICGYMAPSPEGVASPHNQVGSSPEGNGTLPFTRLEYETLPRRPPYHWTKCPLVMEMHSAISLIILSPVPDTWVWTLDGSRSFTVGSAVDKLPTRINLDVRGFDVPSILCPICDSDVAFVLTMIRLVFESSAKEDAKDCFGGFVFFALVARVAHRNACVFQVQFRRTSLTGFPTQSIRSSNAIALDSSYLLVLIIGTSQSRHHSKSESDSYYLSD
ncbi:hypothetical protein Tco_0967974 [Tanacetum coccineum]